LLHACGKVMPSLLPQHLANTAWAVAVLQPKVRRRHGWVGVQIRVCVCVCVCVREQVCGVQICVYMCVVLKPFCLSSMTSRVHNCTTRQER
jgi:hypothetical protein